MVIASARHMPNSAPYPVSMRSDLEPSSRKAQRVRHKGAPRSEALLQDEASISRQQSSS